MAAIGIAGFGPVGGHFKGIARFQHCDGAVLQARGDTMGKEGKDLLGGGRCGHIPVVDRPAQQRVPDAAAHGPAFISRRFQLPQHAVRRLFCRHTAPRLSRTEMLSFE